MRRDAFITGRGALAPVGRGVDALWRASVEGRSGVRAETRDDFVGLSVSPVSAPFLAEDVDAIEVTAVEDRAELLVFDLA